MSCENFTTNGRPVGIGYDANGNAKSLAELTTLIVSSVSATNYQNIYLSSLGDVNVASPDDNTYLKWDGEKWIAVSVAPGGGITNAFTSISDSEANTVNASDQDDILFGSEDGTIDIVVEDNAGQATVNITADTVAIANEISIGDLGNVNIVGIPVEGEYLAYDDGNWVNKPPQEIIESFGTIETGGGDLTATATGDTVTFTSTDNTLDISVDGRTINFSVNESNLTVPQANVENLTTTLANKQPLDTTLTTIASLDPPANSLIYFTGINLAATTTLSPYGRSLIGSTLAKNDIPIATEGGGVDLVSYEDFFKNAFNLTDNVPLNADSSGGPIITDVNKRGSPLHVSEYASGMDVSNTDVWWNTYAPLFFNHNKLQYLASGNPHPQYASSSLSATVSSLQTSTINLSSYISANEGLWSSGAGGVTDHGALSGLDDNDHPQYATLSGAIFTGSILAPSVSATGVSATTFNGKSLAGVTYNSIQDGDILVWDNTSSVWYNSSSLSDLQTSTINLSAYIAANEALWSSGASEPSSVVSIQFETGIVTELNIGEIAWNDDYSTIDIQTSTDTTLQVGQEQVIKVRNETGDTLYNGDVVYVSGVHGTGVAKLKVGKASANTNCTTQNIVGICTQDISHNSDGFITTFGYVRNVNTSAFSVGDVVYLANTAGEYTNTQEAKPSHSIRLGTVARSHANAGVIFVKIDPGYDTTFLHDVENDPPESSGQVLIWNSTSSLYQHGGHNSLADLTVGNPHTQYATLSGATFTGNISGTNMVLTGTLEAATKSFLIDHPTKADMKLRYACLEGPENGVYYRGKTESSIIELPDYWVGLIDENSISINLTPIGHIQNSLRVNNIENNKIELASNDPIKAFFIVYATRKDVPNLLVEF